MIEADSFFIEKERYPNTRQHCETYYIYQSFTSNTEYRHQSEQPTHRWVGKLNEMVSILSLLWHCLRMMEVEVIKETEQNIGDNADTST